MAEHGERSVWGLVDAVSILFLQAYLAARAQAFGHPSPMIRILAQRDHAHSDAVLLERELAIFRNHRQNRPAKRRPYCSPKERAEILQLMRLRGVVREGDGRAVRGASQHHPELEDGAAQEARCR